MRVVRITQVGLVVIDPNDIVDENWVNTGISIYISNGGDLSNKQSFAEFILNYFPNMVLIDENTNTYYYLGENGVITNTVVEV